MKNTACLSKITHIVGPFFYICIMKKHSLFLTAILFFCSMLQMGGQTRADSLFSDYCGSSKDDKITSANAFFQELYQVYELTDSLIVIDENSFSTKHTDALVYYWMGEYAFSEIKYYDCISYGKKALSLSRNEFYELTSECLNLIGVAYARVGDYDDAIVCLEEFMKIKESENNSEALSSALNNIAGVCLSAGQTALAKDYISKAIKIEKDLANDNRLAVRYGMASEIFLADGDTEKALNYAQMAYELNSRSGNNQRAAIRLCQMAAVYSKAGNNEEARICLLNAEPILKESGNAISLSICYNQLGHIELEEGNAAQAAKWFSKGADLSVQTGNKLTESRSRKGLSQALSRTNPAEALRQLELFTVLSDSLYKEESARQINSFYVKYDTAEKEHEIELQKSQLRMRNIYLYSLIVILTLFAVALVLALLMVKDKRKRNAELLKINALKDKFVSIISHDLRNPVAAQRNALHLLQEYVSRFDDAALSRQCELLARSADAQSTLVENLLLWGRAQTGRLPYNPARFDPSGIVSEIAELLSEQLESKGIILRSNIAAGSVFVFADRRIVSAVLRNVISNAVKFSHENGTVEVSAAVMEEKIRLEVKDCGVGIPKIILDQMEETGMVSSTAGTKGEQGSGLGLVACRELLGYEGAELFIRSEEGKGTNVSFELKKG